MVGTLDPRGWEETLVSSMWDLWVCGDVCVGMRLVCGVVWECVGDAGMCGNGGLDDTSGVWGEWEVL